MNLNKPVPLVNNLYNLKKINSSKGQASQIWKYKSELPLQIQHKSLWYSKRWSAGRSRHGWKILRTRGKRNSKLRLQTINYTLRLRNIFFISSFIFNNHIHRLVSVVFLSSGIVTHLITTSQHKLFSLNQFHSSFSKLELYLSSRDITPLIKSIGLIMYLPKNKPVSLMELLPYKGVQYIRSLGVFGVLLKMDLRVHTALVK